MIKVYKSDKAPEKLAEAGYTCDEVKQAILNDQKDKCYLCERKVTTDYQVEHIVSRTNNKEKVNEWENLFIACNYCNVQYQTKAMCVHKTPYRIRFYLIRVVLVQ